MTRIEFFPYPFIIGLLLLVGYVLHRRQKGWRHGLGLLVFGLYLLGALSLVLFPIPLAADWPHNLTWANAGEILARINGIPFNYGREFTRLNPRILLNEVFGNILLTLPFGLGVAYYTRLRGWRVVLLAALTGVALESGQLVVSLMIGSAYRSVDISDVILNAVGVLVGVEAFRLVKPCFEFIRRGPGKRP